MSASWKEAPHKSTIPSGDAPLERIFFNTTGPYNSHTEYAMVITDGYSRMSWVYILPTKLYIKLLYSPTPGRGIRPTAYLGWKRE